MSHNSTNITLLWQYNLERKVKYSKKNTQFRCTKLKHLRQNMDEEEIIIKVEPEDIYIHDDPEMQYESVEETFTHHNLKYKLQNEATNDTATSVENMDGVQYSEASSKRPYKCTVCEKAFVCPSDLKRHVRIHTGERPYSCPICKKTFIRADALNIHIRIHSGKRPYACDVCLKTFSQMSSLIIHKRIHTGKKPHHCHLCEYKSSRAGHLRLHMRTHTGEKPYTCVHCQQSFSVLSTLTRHTRTQHNN